MDHMLSTKTAKYTSLENLYEWYNICSHGQSCSWWAWPSKTKRIVKTARKEQGKAVVNGHFFMIIRVVLKAVL